MDFIPYKVNECLENTFYQVPKELFINPYYEKLNSDSKLLYALLLDRLSVSMKNEWIDEDGNIFLIFSRINSSGFYIRICFVKIRRIDRFAFFYQGRFKVCCRVADFAV